MSKRINWSIFNALGRGIQIDETTSDWRHWAIGWRNLTRRKRQPKTKKVFSEAWETKRYADYMRHCETN